MGNEKLVVQQINLIHCYICHAVHDNYFVCVCVSVIQVLFFFIEFIGLTLLNKIYRFQVYNSIIHHLYIEMCVHHPKSSLFPSPYSMSPHSPFPLVITML